jgi:hypothetical protein
MYGINPFKYAFADIIKLIPTTLSQLLQFAGLCLQPFCLFHSSRGYQVPTGCFPKNFTETWILTFLLRQQSQPVWLKNRRRQAAWPGCNFLCRHKQLSS